jgi:hypothetical protein
MADERVYQNNQFFITFFLQFSFGSKYNELE